MIIRHEQRKALQDAQARNFENEMVRHLHEFSPRHSKVIGDAGVREVVRRGIDNASKYGFTNRGPVRLYLDLAYMFGSDFSIDPLLPWAAEILNSGGTEDQMERAGRLHAKATEFSEVVAGPDYVYAKEAFRRARSVRYEELAPPPGNFESGGASKLRTGFPQKFDYAGEPAVHRMMRQARLKAQSFSISAEPGIMLIATLMFAIGFGCLDDPLFPWISGTLKNEAISDPNKRAERLYSKTMTYIDQVLTNLA